MNAKNTGKKPEIQLIFIFPDGTQEQVEGYEQLNLLAHGQLLEKDLRSKCGGHGECGTCRVRILKGEVTPPSSEEERLLKSLLQQPQPWRLACQCFPQSTPDAGSTCVVLVEVPRKSFPDARDQSG